MHKASTNTDSTRQKQEECQTEGEDSLAGNGAGDQELTEKSVNKSDKNVSPENYPNIAQNDDDDVGLGLGNDHTDGQNFGSGATLTDTPSRQRDFEIDGVDRSVDDFSCLSFEDSSKTYDQLSQSTGLYSTPDVLP